MVKVLVVEGSRHERKQIVEALEQVSRVAVQGAVADAESARRVLASNAPDILVTGVDLPDGAAIDLVAAARGAPNAPSIVVVGNRPSRDEWRRHLEAGADRFVDRDRGLDELCDVVDALVDSLQHGADDPLRVLGRITAGVAHDLNNYLAIADGMIDLLQRDPADQRLWKQLRNATAKASRLTATMTTHARGERPTFEPVDFGALVRDTVELVWGSIGGHIDVTIDIADRLPPVRGMRAELEQLVLNLVLNAADAMPDRGELRIAVVPHGGGIAFAVSDTGPGLDDVVLDRAGVRSPSTKPDRAVGLGLGIVRRVANRHGATLEVRRDREHNVVTLTIDGDSVRAST